jgi:uncharacterized protein DUF4129
MNHRRIATVAVLLAFAIFSGVWASAESISIAEYRRQLHDIAQKVDALKLDPEQASRLVTEIPDRLTVKTGTGEIKVNYKNLKDELAALSRTEKDKREGLLARIRDYIQALTAAADHYDQQGADPASTQGKLKEILSRREFSRVKGPNAKDALMARLYRWLSRLLEKLTIRTGGNFDLVRLFIYLLVGAAAALLAIWTVRRLSRPLEDLPQREIIPFSPSARSWRTWLSEARVRAQQQDWRNAIHLGYWAGISYLEENGAWRPNRARTPREYLRLVGSRAAQYPVLAALTRKLELVWYGYGNAAASDFDEMLGQLEKLGCR